MLKRFLIGLGVGTAIYYLLPKKPRPSRPLISPPHGVPPAPPPPAGESV